MGFCTTVSEPKPQVAFYSGSPAEKYAIRTFSCVRRQDLGSRFGVRFAFALNASEVHALDQVHVV